MGALTTVLTVVDLLAKYIPEAVTTGTRLMEFAESFYQQINGKELTADERAQLRSHVDAAYARLMTPLPPAEPGDPDYVKDK